MRFPNSQYSYLLLAFVSAFFYLEVTSRVATKTETFSLLLVLLLVYAEQGGLAEME